MLGDENEMLSLLEPAVLSTVLSVHLNLLIYNYQKINMWL